MSKAETSGVKPDPPTGQTSGTPTGRSLRHRLEYLSLLGVVRVLSLLTAAQTRSLGRTIGRFTYSVLRIRRKVTEENLRHAFPEWSTAERDRIARRCYESFGITFLELARLPRMSRTDVIAAVLPARMEIFDQALEGGRGGILTTGHLGNWEYTGGSVAALNYPISVTVKSQKNPWVDAYVTQARSSTGMEVLRAEGGFRQMLRVLRNNRFLTFLADQDAGRRGVFVPFFGRLASTPVGVVRFARLTRSPIIPGYAIRHEDGRYELRLPGTIFVREDLPPDEAEKEALTALVAQLEAVIREHPEQWFWMHRRWKTRPNQEKESGQ
jgi:KDO2-lipid IV(A) lauroyltransferase